MTRAALLLPLVLLGCGYQPPSPAAVQAPAYRADLAACQDGASAAVNKQNAKTGLAWMASPVTRWGQIGSRVNTCMADKGYGAIRWCTPQELAERKGAVVVTGAGVQCTDPGRGRSG